MSLCEGNSQLTIYPDPCPDVLADGTGCDDEFQVTDPDCVNGPFNFAIIIGGDYAALTDVDESDGRFRITFRENNTTRQRTVVVRVTSSCTGLSKDFLFIQQGQACNDTLGEAPAITATPAGTALSYCAGGAVYLSVPADTPNLDVLIWTLNGIEIARGVNFLEVTREGRYDIHMGAVGCNQRDDNAVTVTRDGTGAPLAPSLVVLGNNGQVCGPGGTTQLVAMNPNSGGTVLWFKDGVLQDGSNGTDNITGTQVTVGVGDWFAVVQDGDCLSRKSPTESVTVDSSTGTSLTTPVVDKGGAFCAGSTILLSVTAGTFDASYTYIWYENNTQIGTGRSLLYNVPGGVPSVVIRCRATLAGSCAQEALSVETISTGTIPSTPKIEGNTVLCSGTAILNVLPVNPGTYTYAWYKDNTLIGNTQTITVTEGGDYYATVTEGCTSPMAHVNIPAVSSASPVVTLNSSSTTPGQANLGDEITYNAAINFGPATGYEWDIPADIAELLQGGTGYSYALVRYKAQGSNTLTARVTNACGIGVGTLNVTVGNDCAVVTAVTPSGPTARTTVTGVAVTLGNVSASFSEGSPVANYKWYSNGSASNTGGTAIDPVATLTNYTFTPSAAGTYYFYCEADNSECPGSPVPSGVYTVTVLDAPVITGTTPGSRCGAGTVNLSATSSSSVRWYETASSTTILSTNNTFTTPSLSANKTYYVSAVNAGGESARSAVTATVILNAINSTTGGSRTSPGTVKLGATVSAGSTIYWQTSPTGTSTSNAGTSFTTPTLSVTTTYYARPYNATCSWGTAVSATASINISATTGWGQYAMGYWQQYQVSIQAGNYVGFGVALTNGAALSGVVFTAISSVGSQTVPHSVVTRTHAGRTIQMAYVLLTPAVINQYYGGAHTGNIRVNFSGGVQNVWIFTRDTF
ncbi:hypothetical protein ACFO6W_22720 [Dysgonomonas termitidis]|uniref:Ig-like domain-containing protein n=1 Tax=Dysgonomonas termitidis TaxID=1516126 RepID=A0ABV9L235_9BACT